MDAQMTIRYLGTAAAEGLPAVFCNCPACLAARKAGGKNVRTRSQVLINSDFLIDFPMDAYMHALRYRLDLSAVRHVFITHSHMDHCYPQDLIMHGDPYAHAMTSPDITVYGNSDVLDVFSEQTRREIKPSVRASIRLVELQPYRDVVADGYTVTPLPAVHTVGENCFVYLVRYAGKSYLHLNDTGILPDEVYDRLAETVRRIDAVSFDCTYGFTRKGPGRHMGAPDAAGELQKLYDRGLADRDTVRILTHFSHNGGLTHAQLCKRARPLGFKVAYDGYTVRL